MKYLLLIILFLLHDHARAAEPLAEIKTAHQKEYTRFEKEFEEDEVKPEKFSEGFKRDVWQLYLRRSDRLLAKKKIDANLASEQQELKEIKERVEALEYNEDELEKRDERLAAHVKLLNDKIYRKNILVFLDAISWQRDAIIKSPAGKNDLIITNVGFCAGGSYGYRNAFYHFFADGCAMFGHGNIAQRVNNITYRQGNVPYTGLKVAPGAGLIVSSLGAEIGFKLPVVYSRQQLDDPNQDEFPGFKARTGSDLMTLGSLYSRWPFGRWFVQTEFARRLDEDLTSWNIGIGLSL